MCWAAIVASGLIMVSARTNRSLGVCFPGKLPWPVCLAHGGDAGVAHHCGKAIWALL